MTLGPVGETLSRKLRQSFSPERLDVIDESHLHAGHAGAHPLGESHFRVDIVSQAFSGKSRVERHRLVNEALAQELKSRVHALAIKAQAPEDGFSFATIAADDPRLVQLLRQNGLPSEDLAGEGKTYFGFANPSGELAAAGGIDRCGGDALLRSVVVADRKKGRGLGRAIACRILAELRYRGIGRVYLLTQSARDFFAKLGFVDIDRSAVPAAIANSSQFAGTRCASARTMMLTLTP